MPTGSWRVGLRQGFFRERCHTRHLVAKQCPDRRRAHGGVEVPTRVGGQDAYRPRALQLQVGRTPRRTGTLLLCGGRVQ